MSDGILGGWYYPTAPCWPNLDLVESKYNGLDQLCGEFLRFVDTTLSDGSCVELMTEKNEGIGGYSEAHVAKLKQVCKDPYCTVSGRSESGVARMLEDDGELQQTTINKIVNFCKINGLGCDINIEGLASFTEEECEKHALFLDQLGDALKAEGIHYRVVTVAEDGNLFHGKWRNDLLKDVTCDYVVCMQYDRMYDYGRVPITPIDFLLKTTEQMKKSLGSSWQSKYICGLPSYGYKAYKSNEYWVELLTMGQLSKAGLLPLPDTRDEESQEVTWEGKDTVRNKSKGAVYYYYSDQVSLDHKTKIMLEQGVNKFSLWHMFGGSDLRDNTNLNPWFSDDVVNLVKGSSDMEPEETVVEPEETVVEPEETVVEPETSEELVEESDTTEDTTEVLDNGILKLNIRIDNPTEEETNSIIKAVKAVTDKKIVVNKIYHL